MVADPEKRHTVAVALVPGKAKKHLTETLLSTADRAGITLRPFVASELGQLGPVDALLHKIRDPDWIDRLQEYQAKYPTVKVVDSPDCIRNVLNRESMLASIGSQGFTLKAPAGDPGRQAFKVYAPKQVSIAEGSTPQEALAAAERAGLQPPLLAKPMWADGRNGAHELALLSTKQGIKELCSGQAPPGVALPVTLQQYVDHGACLFKVYVLGPITVVARRPSLQLPVQDRDIQDRRGSVLTLVRVSAFHSETYRGTAPHGDPPSWAIEALAAELRQRTGLSLFNFDLLRPDQSKPDALLIDINQFPGYEKLPGYENLMTQYLLTLFDPPEEMTDASLYSQAGRSYS